MEPKRILIVLAVVLVAGLIYRKATLIQPDSSDSSSRSSQVVQVPAKHFESRSEVHPKAGVPSHLQPHKQWPDFAEQFGKHLLPEYSADGDLVAVRGIVGKGVRGPTDFKPTDPQSAIRRAREILDGAKGLMQIQAEWPLENAAAKGSEFSAQVYFSETHDGMVLAPVGNVKVDLGPQGELLAIYSEYAPNVQVSNTAKLDVEEARSELAKRVPQPENSVSHIEGGSKVIWVKGTDGKVAYQFNTRGTQFVLDAMTGDILYSKDRRQF